MPTPAWISLGSNLGDRKATLDQALAALAETPGVAVRAVSSYHETTPIGGPAGQGAFLNAAAHLETTLAPLDLLDTLQSLEWKFGRVRTVRWGERTLDLDILVYGTRFFDSPRLTIPHPRLGLRRFVLGPLAEIAPDLVALDSRRRIGDLLAGLDLRPRSVALEGPDGPLKSRVFRDLVAGLPATPASGPASDLGSAVYEPQTRVFLEALGRELAATGRDGPGLVRRGPGWVVSETYRFMDLYRSAIRGELPGGSPVQPLARLRGRLALLACLHKDGQAGLLPTFVVILPGTRESPREFPRPGAPLLRPGSDEPEAIIAEVLATCRGIEGP